MLRETFHAAFTKGGFWFSELADRLSESAIGIVCLTSENKNKPWILFEAGALNKGLSTNKVCTLLIDLTPNDIKYPLGGFNHTLLKDKNDFFKLLKSINLSMNYPIKEELLRDSFDEYYDRFKNKCRDIENSTRQDHSIDEEALINQIDELKETILLSNNQLPQIREALEIYKNLTNQGVDNVYKCNSDAYDEESKKIKEKISTAISIRAMNHIGRRFFENYEKAIIDAINRNNCRVEILIIEDSLAGGKESILNQLCPETKAKEVEDLGYVQERIQYIKNKIKADSTGGIALKRYSFAPTGSILIIDDFVQFIPYLAGRQGNTSVALFGHKLENGDKVFDEFEEIFTDIWDNKSK